MALNPPYRHCHLLPVPSAANRYPQSACSPTLRWGRTSAQSPFPSPLKSIYAPAARMRGHPQLRDIFRCSTTTADSRRDQDSTRSREWRHLPDGPPDPKDCPAQAEGEARPPNSHSRSQFDPPPIRPRPKPPPVGPYLVGILLHEPSVPQCTVPANGADDAACEWCLH